jgi:hypothetical protein
MTVRLSGCHPDPKYFCQISNPSTAIVGKAIDAILHQVLGGFFFTAAIQRPV